MTRDTRSIVRRSGRTVSSSDPVVTPLMPSVVYRTPDADALDRIYEGADTGFSYAREGHPNASVLGAKLDWLEGVTQGRGTLTASGMAAVSAAFLAFLQGGDHIVAGDQLYGRSLRLLTQDLPRMGFTASLADPTDAQAVAGAIRPETRMILIETVSNPTLRVADVAEIAAIANRHGLILAVDNTFPTPRGFNPLAAGAHVVIHSVTKMLAGHSDVTLGYVAADTEERNRALYDTITTFGLTPSPFACWLAERGLHSFDLRYDRAEATAARLATALRQTPGVDTVLYPGDQTHPDHNRAAGLLDHRFGTMVSFRMTGGRETVNAFLRGASEIPFAPTLGDVATTLSHPASSSHRAMSAEARATLGITEGFIRVSVGIEDPAQIIGELTDSISQAVAATS